MLSKIETDHVKFVSYTGKYPNLCSGKLTLEIDGETYMFEGYRYNAEENVYRKFWSSGGGCKSDWSGTYSGEWVIDVSDIPDKLRKYAAEIDIVFNEHVEFGCCGGCL